MMLSLRLLLSAGLITCVGACELQTPAPGARGPDTTEVAALAASRLPDVCTGVDTSLRVPGDSVALRAAAAARYVKLVSLRDMMSPLSDSLAVQLPLEQRQAYLDLMTQHTDYEALDLLLCNAVAKHLTIEEIEASAAFYGSPIGRSAMQKMILYMTDIVPALQLKMMRAAARASGEAP